MLPSRVLAAIGNIKYLQDIGQTTKCFVVAGDLDDEVRNDYFEEKVCEILEFVP